MALPDTRAVLRVSAPCDQSYDILFAPGALAHLQDILAEYGLGGRRVFIGTNVTLAPLYGRALAEHLNGTVIALPDGEQYKTLDTVSVIYSGLAQLNMDRASLLIALGGGVVGDTVGFVAATYMRGVRLVQIPTSLLAMVDASVGGKTGVDLREGKNMVGAFKQPELVVMDSDVLTSLPDEEWRAGLAEVVKHGLLADPGLLDPDLLTRARAAEMLPRAVKVKVDVVEQDPFEANIRAHLNLGHTFGHALERISGYTMRHGDAVAVGLVAATRLSAALDLCSADLADQVEALLRGLGLPTSLGHYSPANLVEAMRGDKKWQEGRARFVLLNGVAKPIIMEDISPDAVLAVLEGMRER